MPRPCEELTKRAHGCERYQKPVERCRQAVGRELLPAAPVAGPPTHTPPEPPVPLVPPAFPGVLAPDVPVDGVVVGDLVRLGAGDQVIADGKLVSAEGLALDESNLTGESELAVRAAGDPVSAQA